MNRPPKQAASDAPPLPDLTRGRTAPRVRSLAASSAGAVAAPTPTPPPRAPDLDRDTAEELSITGAEALSAEHGAVRPSQPPSRAQSLSTPPQPQSGRASLSSAPSLGRFGRYELLGRIAFGGMAEIFLAREVADAGGRTGRHVVVKRVLPHVAEDTQFVEMFVDEARLAMHLNHPNICHVYAYGEEQGTYYIAMEWIDGMPLSKMIRRAREHGGIPIPVALKIVAQVAEALDHAHRACDEHGEPLGIVHRDVSPQNLMVAFDGPVKLLDFGIAKAASHSTRTEAGVVKGKFAYMSPQQCLGEPIDARADVFALGLCLYEILGGRNPFKRQTEFDTMRAIVYEEAPPLADAITTREPRPEIIAELEHVVSRAISKRPEDRYQSAAELQNALEHLLARTGAVVTSSRVGELMHHLFAGEIKAGPQLDTRHSLPPQRASSSGSEKAIAPMPPPPGETQRITSPAHEPTDRGSSFVPAQRSAAQLVAVMVALLLFAITGGVGAWVAYSIGSLQAQTELVALPATSTPVAAATPTVASPIAETGAIAPAAPTTGTIYVDSTPAGATIELAQRGDVGAAPMEIGLLEPGSYFVRLRLEGHVDWERSIDLRAGERAHVVATLTPIDAPTSDRTRTRRDREPARPPGRVSINSRPWSRVYLGSRLLGTTPIGDVEVASGALRLRFVDRDGAEHTRTITVPPDGHAREYFDLRAEAEGASP